MSAFVDLSCLTSFSAPTSKEKLDSGSPKFIVTLDGVPSPMGNLFDSEMELDAVRPPTSLTDAHIHVNREPKLSILSRLQGGVALLEGVCSCI